MNLVAILADLAAVEQDAAALVSDPAVDKLAADVAKLASDFAFFRAAKGAKLAVDPTMFNAWIQDHFDAVAPRVGDGALAIARKTGLHGTRIEAMIGQCGGVAEYQVMLQNALATVPPTAGAGFTPGPLLQEIIQALLAELPLLINKNPTPAT